MIWCIIKFYILSVCVCVSNLRCERDIKRHKCLLSMRFSQILTSSSSVLYHVNISLPLSVPPSCPFLFPFLFFISLLISPSLDLPFTLSPLLSLCKFADSQQTLPPYRCHGVWSIVCQPFCRVAMASHHLVAMAFEALFVGLSVGLLWQDIFAILNVWQHCTDADDKHSATLTNEKATNEKRKEGTTDPLNNLDYIPAKCKSTIRGNNIIVWGDGN